VKKKIAWGAAALLLLALGFGAVVEVGRHGLGGGRASNERNASVSLKTLTSAECDFKSNDRDQDGELAFWVGDVSRLRYLEVRGVRIELIEGSVADADAAPLRPLAEPMARVGYRYFVMKTDETGAPYNGGKNTNPEKYGFCAVPVEYLPEGTFLRGSSGVTRWTFIVNQENIIWRKDTRAAPVLAFPKDPRAEGWSRLD